jgi:hypothetical protein
MDKAFDSGLCTAGAIAKAALTAFKMACLLRLKSVLFEKSNIRIAASGLIEGGRSRFSMQIKHANGRHCRDTSHWAQTARMGLGKRAQQWGIDAPRTFAWAM